MKKAMIVEDAQGIADLFEGVLLGHGYKMPDKILPPECNWWFLLTDERINE